MRQEPPLFMHQNRAYWGQIAFASIAFDLNLHVVYTYGNSYLHSHLQSKLQFLLR